jgi:tetratricopeptide (TPR) repeat protein
MFSFIVDYITSRDTSLSLYQFLCHHIVGSEETVKTKRTFNTIRDNLSASEKLIQITSGSFGEGLEMKGSDVDMMHVVRDVRVYEDINKVRFNSRETSFVMDMDDCKLGFTQLRLVQCNDPNILQLCKQVGNYVYFSNELLKFNYMEQMGPHTIIHGPCVSDMDGDNDFAKCFHSREWISPAHKWIKRPNTSWPSSEIKSNIIDHGILFVPIGCKGSKNEDIEWRFSFSVGEKPLIYSFTHVQLICYALMKILLKDVIDSDDDRKGLLCSYYIKNIIFWVSEELPLSIWRAENLISCFMRCFERLLYCVEYSMCPHYFIPGINMFENKIEGNEQQVLLGRLNVLYSYGWRCILLSKQLSKYRVISNNRLSASNERMEYIKSMLCTKSVHIAIAGKNVSFTRYCQSPKLKSYMHYFISFRYSIVAQLISVGGRNRNKTQYNQYRTCLSYLLYNLHHDSVSGWLMLASFYYRMKHYNTALHIVSYAVSKCTPEKVYYQQNLSSEQRALIKTKPIQSISIARVLKLLLVRIVRFIPQSTLIPEELELEVAHLPSSLAPVVYSHFLSFLCHYHLNNVNQCYSALDDLQLTISEDYFISSNRSNSYNCLGVAYALIGNHEMAECSFLQAIELDTTYNCAWQRLYMIHRTSTVSDPTV